MATVQEVFDATMSLMDELDDSGNAMTGDTTEYFNRTLRIMNVLIGECYPYSDLRDTTKMLSAWRPVEDMEDDLAKTSKIDNTLALSVMPSGLAANLLVDENPSSASFFQQRYEELLRQKAMKMQATIESIEDVYGGFTSWPYGGIWGV